MSKTEARRFAHLREHLGGAASPEELGYRLGADTARDVVLLKAAVLETVPPSDLNRRVAQGAAAVFPLKPRDLMPEHKGPALGARIKDLEARWIASGFKLTRNDLIGDQ